jgi:hypothetical protein
VVDGHHINGTPPPNTKMSLPGIGYVVLNQQVSRHNPTGLTVTAIHLFVTKSNKQAPTGTQAFVSVATSALSSPKAALLQGLAFGTSADAGSAVIAGKSFPEYLSCLGTGGVTHISSGAGATIPSALRSGTIIDKAKGKVTSTSASGKTSSTVHNLNLFDGKLTATAVKASVSVSGKAPTLKDGSSFIHLKVQGAPGMGGNPPPNTKGTLPGIGTLWLHRQIKTAKRITVIMVQVIVTHKNNPANLPLGATIDVGYASVGLH